jgi:hypothetical protein
MLVTVIVGKTAAKSRLTRRLALHVAQAQALELLHGERLAGERLHDAHAGDALLHAGVHLGQRLLHLR